MRRNSLVGRPVAVAFRDAVRAAVADDHGDLIVRLPRATLDLLWTDGRVFAYASDIPRLQRAAHLIGYTGPVVEER